VVEHEDCFRQIDLVDTSEMFFAEPMVRIYTSAVMGRAQWDSREVGSFLPKTSRTKGIGVGRFDQTRTATNDTRQRPNPGKIVRASLRTEPGTRAFLADRHIAFWSHTPA
jgi:hypothetical protein